MPKNIGKRNTDVFLTSKAVIGKAAKPGLDPILTTVRNNSADPDPQLLSKQPTSEAGK